LQLNNAHKLPTDHLNPDMMSSTMMNTPIKTKKTVRFMDDRQMEEMKQAQLLQPLNHTPKPVTQKSHQLTYLNQQ